MSTTTKQEQLEMRAENVGRYVAATGCTVREAADKFSVSKSTIYVDITERLPTVNSTVANQVQMVLAKNKSERHIRGGLATKRRFENE